MTITLRRNLLIVLLPTSVGIGGWAYVAPVSWLPPLGPFDGHLTKDVGAMFLELGVLSVGGLIMIANKVLVVAALSALVVASVALFAPVRRAGSDI
jgi:hypothetical protein